MQRAAWIAVDWGTTRMRAFAMGADDRVLDALPHGPGMGSLSRDEFEPTLLATLAPWIEARDADDPLDVLVCGMAGARQGWMEAPYRSVPASLEGLLDHCASPPLQDKRFRVRIVPGLSQNDPPDVMRGEETQLLGFLERTGLRDAVVCLPGTHSKWVWVEDARVVRFLTHMTGELFAVLSQHSILRHSIGTSNDEATFQEAVREGDNAKGAVLDRLFALRAAGLVGSDLASTADRLSGLLIGAELATVAASTSLGSVHIIGSGPLAERYGKAAATLGIQATIHDGDALAVAGLARLRLHERRC